MKIAPGPRGTARLDFTDSEKGLFRSLFSDTAVLLGAEDRPGAAADGEEDTAPDELERLVGISDPQRPTDPALLRLLPDVAPDDPERSEEFRRLTEADLRESKLANLRIALHTLGATGRIELGGEQLAAWLTALTDVRLVVASRLEIADDDDVERLHAEEDGLPEHEAMLLTVYDVLSWAQEHLAAIMLDTLADTGGTDADGTDPDEGER